MTIKEPFHEHSKKSLIESLPINSDIGVVINKYGKDKYYLWFYVAENGLIQPLIPRDVSSVTGFARNSNNYALIVNDVYGGNPNVLIHRVIEILAENLYGDTEALTYSLLNAFGYQQ